LTSIGTVLAGNLSFKKNHDNGLLIFATIISGFDSATTCLHPSLGEFVPVQTCGMPVAYTSLQMGSSSQIKIIGVGFYWNWFKNKGGG
jgi:hypothetical protein